jgi:phosphatidylglycerophosphate synthase
MFKYLPKILLYSRLVFCLIIFCITFLNFGNLNWLVLTLLYAGIVSDIFDGIIARKLNISTENFRLLDTLFDLLFYLSILFYIYNYNNNVLSESSSLILSILGIELLMYLISLAKFKKLPSPHAILSKFWGIYLVIEFTLLILKVPGNHFCIALIFGIFVHIDRVLIYVFLKKWDHDIPSSYHAFLIRKGYTITKNKLFNG